MVQNNPTHTSLQYMQYLICETSVIVCAICAAMMVVRKISSLQAHQMRSTLPSLLARLQWNRQQSKINCFCLAGTTLWSHPPNREFPALAGLTQQLAQSNRKKTKRKRSRRKAGSPALAHPLLRVLLLWPRTSCCSGAWGWTWVTVLEPIRNPVWFPHVASAIPASGLSPGPPCSLYWKGPHDTKIFGCGWKVPTWFYQLVSTIHNCRSKRHQEFSVNPSPSHWHTRPLH